MSLRGNKLPVLLQHNVMAPIKEASVLAVRILRTISANIDILRRSVTIRFYYAMFAMNKSTANHVYLTIIPCAVSLTTGPQPLPKPVHHKVRSSASSFGSQHTLVSLRPSGSCLRLLPRLPITFNFPSIFPSVA